MENEKLNRVDKKVEEKQEQTPSPELLANQQLTQQLEKLKLELQQDRQQKAESEAARLQKMEQERQQKLSSDADLKAVLEEADGLDNVDQLSNKQLIDVLANTVSEVLTAKDVQAKEALEKTRNEMAENIIQTQKAVVRLAAAMGLDKARQKFEDFDKYQEQVQQVLTQYPNMDISHAYLLAKATVAAGTPAGKDLSSEKPTGSVTRASAGAEEEGVSTKREKQPERSGSKSNTALFREALARGVERAMASRKDSDYGA